MISWDLQILNGNRVLMVVSYRLTRLPTLLVRTAKQRRGAASFHSTNILDRRPSESLASVLHPVHGF